MAVQAITLQVNHKLGKNFLLVFILFLKLMNYLLFMTQINY